MKQLVRIQPLQLRLTRGDHGHGIPNGVKNLQAIARFLSGLSRMKFNDRRDIAATQPVLGEIRR